jgi:uncharacterized protein
VAAAWYRRAAEQGYAKAQLNLGQMYLRGRGVSKDYVEALNWIRKAADQGDARAEDALGFMYCKGLITRRTPGSVVDQEDCLSRLTNPLRSVPFGFPIRSL